MPISRRKLLIEGAASAAALTLPSADIANTAPSSRLLSAPQTPVSSGTGDRSILGLNQGWRFLLPDSADSTRAREAATIDDTGWDLVHLPHTVRLEPFNASGGRNYQGVCWYRRYLQVVDEWKGRKLLLHFGGAMQVADVYLNGKHLTTHYGGYLPFTIDITDLVDFGKENVLAVRLDNSDNPEVPPGKPQNQLDFVYFGGLYREVRLEILDRVHISDTYLANKVAGGGLFVTFANVTAQSATVQIQADIANERTDSQNCLVRHEIRGDDGIVVASGESTVTIAAGASAAATTTITVKNPKLWHPDTPSLYSLHTVVSANGQPVDALDTKIGIRTFHFDKVNGLTINGRKYVSLGCNRHQDHPYVGYALSASAQMREATKIREAGFTSIRSHYPQHPAFVDACDALGILLIVSNPGWQFIGNDTFVERVYQNAREMVRRDRNHPCVILWEGQLNETHTKKIFPTLQKLIHEEFPFEPCYTAGDTMSKEGNNWDVVYSGNEGQRPFWQREYGDQVDNWGDQQSSVRIMRGWGETSMLVQAWSHARSFSDLYEKYNNAAAPGAPRSNSLCAVDLWAGVDAYRGYHHQPFLGGPIDLFRLPKFDYYLFRSQRPPSDTMNGLATGGPMVFIANFATFQSPTTVTVFSNCEEVRLIQNDVVVATQKPVTGSHLPHPPFSFTVGKFSGEDTTMFMTGVAKPGTSVGELKAEGLIGGQVVATHKVRAPGVPRKLTLEADLCGHDLVADGSDWVRLYARVCDGRGTTHPYAADEVTFAVTGPAVIIDDPRIQANPARAEAGIATVLLRSTLHPGPIAVVATAFGLTAAEMTLSSKPMVPSIVLGRDA